MTIPSSGPITLSQIQVEFAAPSTAKLSQFYAGGPYVPNPPPTSPYQTAPIPTSGPISFGMFRGAAAEFVFNDIVASDPAAGYYNLRERAIAAGWNGTSRIKAMVTITSGVYLIGQVPTNTFPGAATIPAFTTTVLPAGSTVTVYNNGTIFGKGGDGGIGGSTINGVAQPTPAGRNGGPALWAEHPMIMYNNGTIAGGGGGGGGGGSQGLSGGPYGAAGGGGGGGRPLGSAGSTGSNVGSTLQWFAGSGTSATRTAPGSLGVGKGGTGQFGPDSGPGGFGGQIASFGGSGTAADSSEADSTSAPGAGGSPGTCITYGQNITWMTYGARLGAIDHPGTFAGTYQVTPRNDVYIAAYGFAGDEIAAGIGFSPDGTLQVAGDPDVELSPNGNQWLTVVGPGAGSPYWARAVLLNGFVPSGSPMNQWVPLGSGASWSYIRGNNQQGSTFGKFSVDIAASPGGAILSSATYECIATIEI